ncbi:MAG TPA: SMC-Scp complex subunit ScpB [Candidatus Krumholzibacteria bacterium]|nr:SMC-Scp complex subunit ScpB [Candidatus Krumholzibacteria bacterium]
MENPNLDNIVLALLFASDEPLSARKIAAVVEDVTVADVKQAIDGWNQRADAEAWSIGIEQVAGGYRLATRAEYAPYVARLYSGRRKLRLSRAGLETLAIVAYKQPITRAEIEAIRGVGCGSVVANLLERSLVEIMGKAKVLGAPFLYGTTQEFLEYLGLNSIKDLPSLEDLEALLATEVGAETAVEGDAVAARAPEDADEAVDPATALADLARSVEDALVATGEAGESGNETGGVPLAAAAQIGALVDEPVNRPLYSDVKKPAGGGRSAPAPDADDEAEDDAETHHD